ncbi:MAG: glucosidase, partial [Abditibacteriaceae bacterium]
IQISVTNRGGGSARLELLPTFTFRNIWDWKHPSTRPQMKAVSDEMVQMEHHFLGNYTLYCQSGAELLFTENHTNDQRLYQSPNDSPFVKDAFHEYLIQENKNAINPKHSGTKMAARYTLQIQAGETQKVLLRLVEQSEENSTKSTFSAVSKDFDAILQKRRTESGAFYDDIAGCKNEDAKAVQRQALAGLLWCKQFYHYDVERWLEGDPTEPLPPQERLHGRNRDWIHLNNHDVISMPDSWEYPWYASWDLAFHCVTMALVDADFAKNQLILFLREWYQHPNGQIPAYEWAFSDVNPPVHAWAALRVFRMEKKRSGSGDYAFLERVFQKLLLNFTWWVNRKDADDRNIFQGGFLGLDNIGPFDRNSVLPDGARLDQSDGTAWMAMFCLDMLSIALELAQKDAVYEDVATKFLEHFFYIAHAMNNHDALAENQSGDLWDNQDQFYYDLLEVPGRTPQYVRSRSLVGLIPLLAVTTIDKSLLEKLPAFHERLDWFMNHRGHFAANAASVEECGMGERRLFAVVNQERLRHILQRMLDENEFLSPHGIRSVSRFHLDNPFRMQLGSERHELNYEPAESQSGLFGGNSNWRGPVWMPINYLLIEALQKFDY